MFDVLIIGGGASGVSCAQILGSAFKKSFMAEKKIGIIMHQKSSMLQEAVFYNAYGIVPGTKGTALLKQSFEVLNHYSKIIQIEQEKVSSVIKLSVGFEVKTNKNKYRATIVVVAINSSGSFSIDGLMQYVEPHGKSLASKKRVQLANVDHLVAPNLYVAGTLAGHSSQVIIAAGSGAMVATDILTVFNEGIPTHSHDSLGKPYKK